MSLEEIEEKYGYEKCQILQQCPVHGWRAETGIELIHKEPTKEELERIWKNWKQMPYYMKLLSNKKSFELFGVDNEENYRNLIKQY